MKHKLMVFMLLVILLTGCEQVQKIQEEQQLQVKELEKQNITKQEEKIEVPKPAKVENKTKEIEEQKNVQQNLSKQNSSRNKSKENSPEPAKTIKAFFDAIAYKDFNEVPKYVHKDIKNRIEEKCREERGLDWTADRIIERNAELLLSEEEGFDVEIIKTKVKDNTAEVYFKLESPKLLIKRHYTLKKEGNEWLLYEEPPFLRNCLLISEKAVYKYMYAKEDIDNALKSYNAFRPRIRIVNESVYDIYYDARKCEEHFSSAEKRLNSILSEEGRYLGSIDKENLRKLREWTNKMKWACRKYKEAYWYLYIQNCRITGSCKNWGSLLLEHERKLSEAQKEENSANKIKERIPDGWKFIPEDYYILDSKKERIKIIIEIK